MIRTMRALAAIAVLAATAIGAEDRYQVVCNFTEQLPSSPAVAIAPAAEAKVGLAAAEVRYAWTPGSRQAVVGMPERGVMVPGPGTLKLWVKGDGSRNRMRLVLFQARQVVEPNGNRYLTDHREIGLEPVVLDGAEWREVSFDAKGLAAGQLIWWHRLEFAAGDGEGRPAAGTVLLDDLRLFPTAPMAGGSVTVSVAGPALRDLGTGFALGLDVRNFTTATGDLRVRVAMVDRNQNQVLDRDFTVPVTASSAVETRLDLDPQQIAAYLPPFRITGDVLGAGLPDLTQRIDRTLVVANGLVLWTAMGDALGQWFTAGANQARDRWGVWQMGAGQRASATAQTTARLVREDIPADQAQAVAGATPGAQPLGRYALGVAFDGEACVYRGADRIIPGNAFGLGLWVRGDGSGARVSAAVLDFSDLADFWEGGWKRTFADIPLCTLDFTGWRYIEIGLPGAGLGTNLPRGSTQSVDFPLELSAFRVTPAEGRPTGSVAFGAIYARTQVATADTLSLHLGYDDPEQRFEPGRGAWLTVHNGAPTLARRVEGRWEVLDRAARAVASGTFSAQLAPGAAAWERIDLGKAAGEIAKAAGPLTLTVTAADAADATASATRALGLAKPDSVVLHEDFESVRGYLGLRADGVPHAPEAGRPAATSTDAVAHGGERSLRIPWEKSGAAAVYVAIDPELAGIPTEISFWVHGDGSGALVHPVIGDRAGIPHGVSSRTSDLLLARTDGALQNAVRIDWQGWRQVVFRLPPVPPDWAKDAPVRPYLPSYPLGLHLAVDGRGAPGAGGEIAIDDIEVTTHLDPAARVSMRTMREGAPNIVPPGTVARVRLANADRTARRTVSLSGGVFDAAGRAACVPPAGAIELAPGEVRIVDLVPPLTAGAYALRLEQDGATLAASEGDLIVGDPTPLLGEGWASRLADEGRLRAPLADPAVIVDEDWDWVERFPGNIQLDTLRERAAKAKADGMSPWMLLGYSAFWAAGTGLEQLEANRFVRPPRDIGHGIDIFLVPQRMEHWRDYVAEVMRGVGPEVGGFVLWDNPDGGNSLAVPPERFAAFAREADAWRRRYCPETPMIIGGMAQATALPYLAELAKADAIGHIGGIDVRFDVGRLSPEDAQVAGFARQARAALDPDGKRAPLLRFSDLDWAVERGGGFDAFTQAAYLVRSDLTLGLLGVSPALKLRNGDWARLGQGMAYRTTVHAPPLKEQRADVQFKPAWWAMARCRRLLATARPVIGADVADTIDGRTRCLLLRREDDGGAILAVWRNDDAGTLSLGTLAMRSAEDCFGGEVRAADGWLPIGKVPVFIALDASAESAGAALGGLRVRDGAEPTWPQRPLAMFDPGVAVDGYRQRSGEPAALAGRTVDGAAESWPGLRFPAGGGEESFRVTVPAGAGLVLRHRYLLDKTGFTARISVDGVEIGSWDLRHAEAQLGDGLRESAFAIPASRIAGKASVEIGVAYAGAATSGRWTAFAESDKAFPLSAFGPIHADQAVGHPRLARNMVGAPLAIGTKGFTDGIAVYADSLLEFPIARQFSRFRARIGVDAATDGKGSVVFEVWADGAKRWNSPTISGLDEPRDLDLDITGVDRLRLVVRDAGDGNRFDAANWAAAELIR